MERRRRRSWRVIVVGALVVVPLAACGSPTTQPQRGVTIRNLQHKSYFYQGDYLARTITVSARVDDVLSPRVFELSDEDYRAEKLLVVTDQPVEVSKDEAVRVTGTVGQLHRTVPSEGVPYIQRELYARQDTDAYLYHATVESPAR